MAFSLGDSSTRVGYSKLVESAIRSSIELEDPDWTSILAICDLVQQKKIHPKNVLVPIQSQLKSENPQVVILTLEILDVIVHNCGSPSLYAEIVSKPFIEDLYKLYEGSREDLVKKRVLTLLQLWALSLGRLSPYKLVAETVTTMKNKGITFPTVKEEDALLLFKKPPTWTDSPSCTACGVEFGLQIFRRKHHCRACGKVFCYYCSRKIIKLPQFGTDKMERVCDSCFDQQVRLNSEGSSESEAGLDLDFLRVVLNAAKEAEEKSLLDMAIALSLSEQENNTEDQTHSETGVSGEKCQTPSSQLELELELALEPEADAEEMEVDGASDFESESESESESEFKSASNKIDNGSENDSDSDSKSEEEDEKHPHGILDSELVTMDDFRDMLSDGEVRQDISVRRTTLVTDILARYAPKVYAKLNLLAQPSITFSGESGIDAGALRKEYFFSGILGLDTFAIDGHPIFEGQPDHRLLSIDGKLLANGTFYSIGRFMTHSCIHMGIAFIGLSQAAATYILMSDEDLDYEKIKRIPISFQDLPSQETVAVFHTAQKIQRGEKEACTLEEMEQLDKEIFGIGFNEKVTPENSVTFQEELLFHHVISSRRFQLEEIRKAFKECKPLWEYLRARPYLHSSIFPSSRDLDFPVSALLGMIEINGEDHQVIQYFKEFITELGEGKIEGATLRQLCELWTGSPIIRGERLVVKTEPAIEFIQVQACFNTFILPENIEKAQLFEQLRMACVYASKGFEDENLGQALNTFFDQLRQLLR